jgi:alkanesulfonate monooxygenase SsuD/methylene tetrahydromethanopterin reductase-like flavin-dependent oxidoreductase (luciferase family)
MSGGRAGWNVVISGQDAEAKNFGMDNCRRTTTAMYGRGSAWRSAASVQHSLVSVSSQ